MQIEIDKWYKNYSYEDFMELIKKFPKVPFFVDGSSTYVSGEFFRWNDGALEGKKEKEWGQGSLEAIVLKGSPVEFIVFKSALLVSLDEVADKVSLCISNGEDSIG